MTILAKARGNLNLTPAERALLKLAEGALVAGAIAALPVVAQALATQRIDWAQALRTAVATFAVAGLLAATKYLKAQNDPPLATTATATSIEQAADASAARWAGIPSFDAVPTATPPPPVPNTTEQ